MSSQRPDTSDQPAQAKPAGGPAPTARAWTDPAEMLAQHCRQVGAEGGAILRVRGDGRVDVFAVHPAPERDGPPPSWLTEALVAANDAMAGGPVTVKPLHDPDQLYGQPARRHVALAPLRSGGVDRGVLVLAKQTMDAAALAAEVQRGATSVPVMGLCAMHLAAAEPPGAAPRLQPAMAVLAAVNEHDRFLAAAMAFCNELAARWQCERASLGFLDGQYARLAAMSHTEQFSRKTHVVQLIEAAMEECLDQDVEVAHPAGAAAEAVNRCARELSDHGGRMSVLSLPLRRRGEPLAAVTLERAADESFAPEEIETLRLSCELCVPRLVDLRRQDRWIGAKAAGGLRRAAAAAVGPRYTWLKVLSVLLVALGIYLAVAGGEYRIEAPFVLQATRQQVVPAPFSGQIESASVTVGDEVRPGEVMARLKTLPLERELNGARAERFEFAKQADAARAEKKWAEAQMAAAKVRQLDARIELLTERIEEASLKARIDATVVKGELERLIGASVEKGQVLLEIAPVGSLRAELSVPEDQVADLLAARRAGEVRGTLAAASYPGEKLDFVVERVHPLAEEADGRRVFKVRARLERTRPWMRPGMEGLARVSLERRRLLWIWTRRLVNWLRLWLWL
jgi:multidrug efflux pump subunit AcrA (membrane-fusion protein)